MIKTINSPNTSYRRQYETEFLYILGSGSLSGRKCRSVRTSRVQTIHGRPFSLVYAKVWHCRCYCFFVLSGYVIAYVVANREKNARDYVAARVSRITSVAFFAILVGIVFDSLGAYIKPEYYAIPKVLWDTPTIESYIASIFFVNEWQIFQLDGVVPGTNAPYWSLSFEVTYYFVAGLLLFAPIGISIPLTIVVLILAGWTITLMFPLWVLGYFLYYFRGIKANTIIAPIGFIGSMVLLVLAPIYATKDWNELIIQGQFYWGRGPFVRNLLQDYIVALAFSVHLVCARSLLDKLSFQIPHKTESLIRWLGAQTFCLYLLHYPLLCFLSAMSPFDSDNPTHAVFLVSLILFATAISTKVTDNIKDNLRQLFSKTEKVRNLT